MALFPLFSVIDDFEWFYMANLHNNIQLMLEFLKAPFLVLHVPYYTLMTLAPDDIICDIVMYTGDTTLSSKGDQASDLWQQLELASELEFDLRETV